MKRLYVGGLSHTVTDKDLKDRFEKFGKVEDVELKTRSDEQGVPYKTFGYINITISDSDLKKCQSVLNKSKWKGGTLQIETAKESFLHRLCQEREDAAQLKLNPPKPGHQQQVLDSFKQAGVNNFIMKSAVPGTEIPGHKDWVVGKFGRVLPVMQLKCRRGDKVRTLKYDPSKFGQNLRVLAPPPDTEATPTPVSELTWEVEGGDEEISRRRRGEFPPFTPPQRKKTRSSCNGYSRPITRLRPPLDSESDEELRQIVSEQSSHNALGPEDDGLEVVSLDFLHSRRKDEDCDSGDTDELFSSRKPLETENKMAPDKKLVKKRKKQTMPSQYDSTDEEGEEGDSGKKKQQKVKKMTKMAAVNNVETERDKMADKETVKCEEKEAEKEDEERTEETNQGTESEESNESDYDYDALFSNVTRLEMSLSDLQTLAEKYAPEDWTTAPRILSDDEDDISGTSQKTPKKGTTPEEILASILEGGSSDEEEERKGKKKKKKSVVMSLPAFRGTQELEEEEQERMDGGKMETKEHEAISSSKEETDGVSSGHSESFSSEEEEEEEDETDDEEASESKEQQEKASEKKNESSSSEEEDSSSKTESSSEEEDEEETTAAVPQPIRVMQEKVGNAQRANQKKPAASKEVELQRRANERRLAAVHQRQKEAEENRKLIQGALSKLDAPSGGSGGKHIVFGSDDDEEDEDNSELQQNQSEEQPVSNQQQQKQFSAPRLFDSDEEDDDDEDDKDTDRFEIRPEFEGAAGQKLMELQSRFGTDKRFKMDARFLDDNKDDEEEEDSEMKAAVTEEEEALEEEKKKNLLILQNLLGTNTSQTVLSKTKAKTFRDVSALHYDPSKEEHAAFETKTEEKKESKASRKKKREEAQKLPEVSKDIYFSVSTDLKEVFGKETEKTENQEQEETNWDQEEEEELGDKDTRTEEEQGGFKFSFFGDDLETQPEQTEYKVESVAPPKLSWQQRMNDSSEEEEREEEEREVKEEEKTAPIKATEETSLTSDLFFFFTNDQRLTDGPKWFCRTSLEDQRESWEETRTQLRQDYRKKHKDARRKLRGSQL